MELELTQKEAAYILTVIDYEKRASTELIIETVIGETQAKDLAQSIKDKILKTENPYLQKKHEIVYHNIII